MKGIRIVNLEEGMPTVEEARKTLLNEISSAKEDGIGVLKIIHGYGSSGVGGALRIGVRKSLSRRKKENVIRLFIVGEKWSIFDEEVRALLDLYPALKHDSDLENYNNGITFVAL